MQQMLLLSKIEHRLLLFILVTVFCLFGIANIWSSSYNYHSIENGGGSATERIRQRENVNTTGGSIPKILHYVFKSEMAFDAYRSLINGCLEQNPHWQVMLWRDSDSERLISQHYNYFIDKYKGFGDRLEKSDSVRYMILHRFGGIYLDMDVQCLKPFDQLPNFNGMSAFLGEERREQTRILYAYSYYTMNSLMGSRPGHPFFLSVIRKMLTVPRLNHARLSTGPEFLTNVYLSWASNCSSTCLASNQVDVLPARLVSPLMDTSLVNWEQKCGPYFQPKTQQQRQKSSKADVWKALGCGELVAKGWQFDDTDNGTVAIHKFLHLGYGSQRGLKTFDLLKQFPRIKTYYKP